MMLHMPTPMLMGGGGGPDPYSGADIVLDFAGVKNAGVPFYRVDGVQYASAATAGFTGTGTFDASGYTAAAAQFLSGSVALTGDFIVFAEFAEPAAGTDRLLWSYTSAANLQVFRHAGGLYRTNPVTSDSTAVTKSAFGRSGGARKTSWNGESVATGAALAAQAAATFYIGNLSVGSVPWAAPIKLITIHKATLSDAQIQALGA